VQSLRLSHLVAVCAILVLVACEKVPLTAPTGSTITLSVDKTAIPIGGTATVSAVVTEAGNTAAHNGTMVTFSGGFGTFSPQQVPTSGGVARTTYTGTTSGIARIKAFSGGAATEGEGIEVRVGGAAAERITVRAEPATLTATGGTVTVVANVQDAAGGILPNTPVNFSTDNGTLGANTVSTDASGEARVQLSTTKTSIVTAAVGTKTATITITAVAAPGIAISACTTAPVAFVPVSCTFTVTVATGGALVTNLVVNWGDGTGDRSLGPINAVTTVPTTYSASGVYTVSASATDANGQIGRSSLTLNVGRSLPTLSAFTCPATLNVGVAGAFSVTPPANPSIPISNITVDFGDGSSRNLGAPTGATGFAKSYSAEGAYTVNAAITDTQGQRGASSCSVIVTSAAAPTITTFAQTSETTIPAVVGGPAETFNIVVSAAPGLQIRSVVVTKQDGEQLYSSTTGGTFATSRVARGDILTLRVTDSAGNTAQSQLVVQ